MGHEGLCRAKLQHASTKPGTLSGRSRLEHHAHGQREEAVVPQHLCGEPAVPAKSGLPDVFCLTTVWSLWVENKLLL